MICRICTRAIQQKLWSGFSKQGTGMLPRLIKWLDPFIYREKCDFINYSLGIKYPLHSHLSLGLIPAVVALLFQLVDCLEWRVQNKIDDILSVSFLFLITLWMVATCSLQCKTWISLVHLDMIKKSDHTLVMFCLGSTFRYAGFFLWSVLTYLVYLRRNRHNGPQP